MTDAVLSLQKALMAHLRSQPALQPWLGTQVRVYDLPPKGVIYPWVGFGRVQARSIGGVGVELVEQSLNLMVVSRYDGTEEAKAIVAVLREVLDEAELSLDGQHLVALRVGYVDVFRGSDQRTIYGLVRLRAVSEAFA